ncbi:MAG: prevent-host-death protein [Planctomycetes bacterium RBG_16_59_8]|nr:MAG: prevent-host-death protein [Planctomycetes bacterium RBG_16_59_8]
MKTIPAKEIKRRGISAVDEALKKGPVHVIKDNELKYVVMSEERYREILEENEQSAAARLRESLEDLNAGRVTTFRGVDDLMKAIEGDGE